MTSPRWKLLEGHTSRPGPPRILTVVNQKGGVGKTTTSVNLAAALALEGRRVLLVDLDPQANAATALGIDHRFLERSSYELLIGEADLGDAAVGTGIPNLACVPGAPDLAGAEVELVDAEGREKRLAVALGRPSARFDVLLIDCPPSLGLLTVNALAAADDLVVPVQCEYFALEGLGQLVGNAERVRRSVNPDLRVLGFLLTMYDARTKLAGQVGAEVRAHFGELVFRTVIPRSVRLSEAPSFGEPVLTLDPSSRGSISYRLLAAEVSARLGLADRSPADAEETPPSTPAATDMAAAGDARPSPPALPGPGGRGYGVVSAEPEHLDHAWPIGQPWVGAP